MSTGTLAVALGHIRRMVGRHSPEADSDQDLLRRFVAGREDSAFGELLHRYGPMVLGVCRRVLRNEHDAEDAFQATFLVLARNAASVRRQESLASWLYGVAARVAAKARVRAARRHEAAAKLSEPAADSPAADDDVTRREVCAVLDEEIRRLPRTERDLLILCHLQGLTHEQAARSLGLPVGSMSRRITQARDRLRGRLVRRGVAVSVGALAVAVEGGSLRAAPSSALVAATVRGTMNTTARGTAAGLLSSEVVTLAQDFLREALMVKLKFAGVAALALVVVGLAAGALWNRPASAEGAAAQSPARETPVAAGPDGGAPDLAPAPEAKPASGVAELRDRLKQPITFDGFDADPQFTFGEALAFLADRLNVSFNINEGAFKGEKVEDVLSSQVARTPLPKMVGVSAETVLRRILDRVPSESGVTYLVKPGLIEITTVRYATPSQWDKIERGEVPTVRFTFDAKTLGDALHALSEETGITVLLDPKVGDKAKTPVTANLQGVPLDTAVGLLADMAGLRAVAVDNVLYVTTEENAKQWESRRPKEKEKPKE